MNSIQLMTNITMPSPFQVIILWFPSKRYRRGLSPGVQHKSSWVHSIAVAQRCRNKFYMFQAFVQLSQDFHCAILALTPYTT